MGFAVLAPFVTCGLEANLRYSDPATIEARPTTIVENSGTALREVANRPHGPFNRMDEWGADGRIVAGGPVHSPFSRRRKDLPLT